MSSLANAIGTLRTRIDASCTHALQRTFDAPINMPEMRELIDAAHRATASGKRFRAIGAYIGAAVTTDTAIGAHELDDLTAALELYQASALAHDDVIDHADTRRGAPTPHRSFQTMHANRVWLGNSETFGQASAILLGDLLFSSAESAINRFCGTIPPLRAEAVRSRYSTMHAEVALGQYLDIRAEQLPLDLAHDKAICAGIVTEVVRLKSARYSVVHPVLLGAAAVGATRELLTALDAIVHPWGMAFQYRDDVLGVFGDPEVTGKPAGDDIIEGKRTQLLSLTWHNATPEERRIIAHTLELPAEERHQNVSQLRDIITTRGLGAMETSIRELVDEGHSALRHAVQTQLISENAAQILSELAAILTQRTA